MIVRPGNGEAPDELTVARKSVRYSTRPLERLDELIDFRNDCAFLTINEDDIGNSQRVTMR